MPILRLLLLAFVVVPIVEIWVLIEIGSVIGAPPTIGLVVLTAVVGAVLIRAQGFSTIARVQASLDRGELPAVEIVEGAVLLVAGALLLTPGFVTDAIGFVCLTPPLRRELIRRFVAARVEAARRGAGPGGAGPGGGAPDRGVIEGEYRREDD